MKTEPSAKKMQFFRDDQGKITIWQWPNIPLYGWLVFKVLSILLDKSQLQVGFDGISKAFLFTWAYLEITQGVNYFRRLLGLFVMIALILGYFKNS